MLSVRSMAGLDALSEGYAALFAAGGRANIFLSLPWFNNFQRCILSDHEEVLVLGVEDAQASTPLGALVLRRACRRDPIWRPTVLQGLTNFYSCNYGLLLSPEVPSLDDVASALAAELTSGRHRWDVLNLSPLDPELPAFHAMIRSLRETGMAVQPYFCFGNWYLKSEGRSYAEYANSLPTVLKETIRRKGKRFSQSGGRIDVVGGGSALDAAIGAYLDVYSSSWKIPEPFPRFIPGLIRTCSEQGWLRLGVAYVGKKPVAAQLWIVSGGSAAIFKLAYDEEFAKLSAGTLLTSALMQQVLDVDKVTEVDYLSGDDEYKKSWMSHRRERWGIMAFNLRSGTGMLLASRHLGGRRLKDLWLRARGLFPGYRIPPTSGTDCSLRQGEREDGR